VNLDLAKALDRVLGGAIARTISAWDGLCDLVVRHRPPIDEVHAIVVTKLWGIGNWALLRPVVLDLRARFPAATLHVVTLEQNLPLVRDLADVVHVVRTRGLLRTAADVLKARRRLARARPQLSVDFEQFAAAGALLARTAHVPQRIGFSSGSRGRDGLLTVRVPFRRDAHASRSFRDLVEAAGVPAGDYVPGALAPTPAGAAEAAGALPAADGVPLVVLHPGSGDNFPGRRWSEAGFAAVGRRAAEVHGAVVAVTGSAGEEALCARVAAATGPRAVSLAGRLTLEGWVGVLARAAAVVSNDTGPVHLASALGRPVLALFGPNTPVLYGPLSRGSRALYRALPCSPCLTVESYRSSRCRIPTCMGAIPTGEACAALSAILEEAAALPAAEPSCARA
jgi:ADP-heptose:LPS heptosyltransferase